MPRTTSLKPVAQAAAARLTFGATTVQQGLSYASQHFSALISAYQRLSALSAFVNGIISDGAVHLNCGRLGPARGENGSDFGDFQYGREAVRRITQARERPYFLYLAFQCMHAPIEAPQKVHQTAGGRALD